jgi:hypothetical protein
MVVCKFKHNAYYPMPHKGSFASSKSVLEACASTAAWASGVSNVIPDRPENWPQATLPETAGIQEPLLL